MKNFLTLLNDLSKPNPKFVQDKFHQEIAHNRTKAVLVLECLLLGSYALQLLQNKNPAAIGMIIFSLLTIITLLLSCRSHPEVFNVFYNIVVATYGPFHLYYNDAICFSWKGIQTFPIIVLLFTGSVYHCVIQAFFQLILLKTVYEPAIINSLSFSSPEAFGTSFSSSTLMFTPLVILFVASMQMSLQNAYKKISVVEKKKEEIEKQKVFLLGFSHELRNLINSIMGNVSLASLENPTNKVKDFLSNAEFCGKMLLHLVNNILDTGKAEIGDLEINPCATKVYDTMENIWSICSELIKRKNLKGVITIQKNIPRVLNMDHYRLTQIFLNLVGNAVKFTDTGSINVNVEWIPDMYEVSDGCFEPRPFRNNESDFDEGMFEKTRNISILGYSCLELDLLHRQINKKLLLLPTNCHKGVLKVTVSDTGNGINETDLSKLFQKFTQVNADSAKRKLGTGLGLFITKELCNKMGGDIQVFSRPGEGTCFIFCVPMECVIDHNRPVTEPVTPPSTFSGKKLKAMVVDDMMFSRDLLKDYLQKLDIEVVDTAINGLEAYKKFTENSNKNASLNIVVMDLDMPLMNGKDAAWKIREYEARMGLEPCLLMIASGNCGHAEIDECIDKTGFIRADVFLRKPLEINDIARAIANFYNSRKMVLHNVCLQKE